MKKWDLFFFQGVVVMVFMFTFLSSVTFCFWTGWAERGGGRGRDSRPLSMGTLFQIVIIVHNKLEGPVNRCVIVTLSNIQLATSK